MKPDIVTIGGVNLDIVMGIQDPWPQPGTEVLLEHSELREGGAAGNTALALEGLGCRHRLVANMGTDFFGDWLRGRFGALAGDWVRSPLPTTFSVGIVHPGGERTFFSNIGHLSGFCVEDVLRFLPDSDLPGTMLLFTGTFLTPRLTAGFATLLPRLRARGARIALDTGWPAQGWTDAVRAELRGWLPHCDELLLNEVEISGLAGCAPDRAEAAAVALLPIMPDGAVAVVKRDARGAVALTAGGARAEACARAVAVIDSIGAGDCFNAGYLAARVEGRDLAAAVLAGVEVATTAISTSPRRYRDAG